MTSSWPCDYLRSSVDLVKTQSAYYEIFNSREIEILQAPINTKFSTMLSIDPERQMILYHTAKCLQDYHCWK